MGNLKCAVVLILFVFALLFMFEITVRGEQIIVDTEQQEEPQELEAPTEKEDPHDSSLVINKQLISGVWHVGCDVMGNQAWVKDEISNPKGIKSREGHRLIKCGDPNHWIIYLDANGKPFMMDEIESGATGGTLHTKFYTDNTYQTEMSIADIQCGDRIYWTTWHNDQVWHHTGITVRENPEFTFLVNDVEYKIEAGSTLLLSNLDAGVYEIIEKYDPDYFVADVSIPFVVNENCDVVAEVTLGMRDEAVVNFTNQRITPDPPQTEKPSETEKKETEVITEAVTEKVPEAVTEPPTEVPTETEPQTEAPTEPPTERQTEPIVITEEPTESHTETESEEIITEQETQTVSEVVTEHTSETEVKLGPATEQWNVTENVTVKSTETQKTTEKPSIPQNTNKNEVTNLPQETLPVTTVTPQTVSEAVMGAASGVVEQVGQVLGQYRPRETEKKKKSAQRVAGVAQSDQVVEMYEPTNLITPKTGDDTPLMRLVVILIAAGVMICTLVYLIKNRR